MLFWIVATLLALVITAMLVVPLLRRAQGEDAPQQDVAIYRDQLAEVDRDVERGLLNAEDAERTRTEISRRLLAVDDSIIRTGTASRRTNLIATGISALCLVGGTLFLYDYLGAPGYPDIPLADRIAASETIRANRISQQEAEGIAISIFGPPQIGAETAARIAELQAIVDVDPNDADVWSSIVGLAGNAGDYSTAARAQQQVIALAGEEASTGDHTRLAILLVLAADGYVSPETESVLQTILTADPDNIPARYYYGLIYYETDRPDIAFRLFRDIVNEGEDDNPFVIEARKLVEDAAFRAGVDYTLPPLRGPSIEELATDLTPEQRDAMIADMVNRLSTRLANEGGPVEDWARLINALTVLGDTDQAQDILREARQRFATSPEAMEALDFVAGTTGLDE